MWVSHTNAKRNGEECSVGRLGGRSFCGWSIRKTGARWHRHWGSVGEPGVLRPQTWSPGSDEGTKPMTNRLASGSKRTLTFQTSCHSILWFG